MPTRRQQQAAETRASVLAFAKLLFANNGYEATTIRGISTAAGLSTGSVFAHFKDKADLYREIYGHAPVSPEVGAGLLRVVRQALDGNIDAATARALVAQAEEA